MASGVNRLARNRAVSNKISKIMHEGIRGKKVSKKQAIAVAINMMKKHKY